MSHVVEARFSVKDIEALKGACPKMGLVFHEGRLRDFPSVRRLRMVNLLSS